MPDKVRWGILSTAAIGTRKVIPGMQKSAWCDIAAIASRDLPRARQAADTLGIPRAYGSYEELLNDPDIEAIYNPLPNHLHVPWSIRAARAGKHVLCEKPISMDTDECRQLIAVRDETRVKIGEAFMVRTTPRWLRVRELVRGGAIGELKAIAGFFSYNNANPENIRNVLEYGGGALMDIGCYPITLSRWLFDAEPVQISGAVERDPVFRTDRLTSAVLEFPTGHAIFTSGTQIVPYQRMQIFGTRGRIEVEIPFNAPPDRPTRLVIDDGSDLFGGGIRSEEFPACDQYTVQGDEFSRAVRGLRDVPVSLEDALKNMEVIERIFGKCNAAVS